MKIFDFFKKKPKENSHQTKVWDIENKDEFLIEMDNLISKKCNYGDNMAALNEHERFFFIAQEVEREVNNGGFDQFFFNSSGNLSNEIVKAFKSIGADTTAKICQTAIDVFNGEVPIERGKRHTIMLEELNQDESGRAWNNCDSDFYRCPDNLADLKYTYIMEHKDSFR